VTTLFFFHFNFLLQEKQVDLLPKLKEKINTPEGVLRLFDLIKVQDERMKLAFFAALGNTVVAKDLDQVVSSFFSKS
jgi:structural maintenance of chromosome 4